MRMGKGSPARGGLSFIGPATMSPLSPRTERFRVGVDMVTFVAGQLPKELRKLVNLKVFDVYDNKIEGQLSIRTERFSCCD